MTIRSTTWIRTGSVLCAATLAGLMLVGCTPGASQPGAQATSAGPIAKGTETPRPDLQEPVAPTEVPGPETAPPVVPTNAPGRQDSVLKTLPGEAKSGCVDVGSQRDVRSGTMAAGNFADARTQFSGSPTSAIPFYFIPADATGDPELVVKLKRLDGSGSGEIRSSQIQTADEWQYYPVMITIPSVGKWQIKASAGTASSGCWVTDFSG
jgi:hypothetical protein